MNIRMITFDLLFDLCKPMVNLVTHEYLRTKEHNDSTLFYLELNERLLSILKYYKTLPPNSHALPNNYSILS